MGIFDFSTDTIIDTNKKEKDKKEETFFSFTPIEKPKEIVDAKPTLSQQIKQQLKPIEPIEQQKPIEQKKSLSQRIKETISAPGKKEDVDKPLTLSQKLKKLTGASKEFGEALVPPTKFKDVDVKIPFKKKPIKVGVPADIEERVRTIEVIETPRKVVEDLTKKGLEAIVLKPAEKLRATVLKTALGKKAYNKLTQSVFYNMLEEIPRAVGEVSAEFASFRISPTAIILGSALNGITKVGSGSDLEKVLKLKKVVTKNVPSETVELKPDQLRKVFNTLEGDKAVSDLLNNLPNKKEVIKNVLRNNKTIKITIPKATITEIQTNPKWASLKKIFKIKEAKTTPTVKFKGEFKVEAKPVVTPVSEKAITPLIEEAKKYKSAEEFKALGFEVIQKKLYGVNTGDIVSVPVKDIKIKWKDDLKEAKRQMRKQDITEKTEPVEFLFDIKKEKYILDDGHNRYVAAKRQRIPLKGKITSTIGNIEEMATILKKKTGKSIEDIYKQAHKEVKEIPTPKATLSQQIKEKKVSDAIQKTAIDLKEEPSKVKRVVASIQESKTKFLEYIQSTEERVRQLVNRKDLKITDETNPYTKMTLFHGRVGDKIEKAQEATKKIVFDTKKLADEVKTDSKKIRKEISDYLWLTHAPERNVALGVKAAGITTENAKKGLAEIKKLPHSKKS